jgi:DTW domain-containing protein YfiP
MRTDSSQQKPCPLCGFRFNCICKHTPALSSKVNIALLLHPNEVNRSTNTGKLVSSCLNGCTEFVWNRVSPPEALLALISDDNYAPILLFPNHNSSLLSRQTLSVLSKPPLFIILDATWQEAKKMVRQSPWLSTLPAMQLQPKRLSTYSLRRNQENGNLCTCETAAELLTMAGEAVNARDLMNYFDLYLQVYQSDKSGHQHT